MDAFSGTGASKIAGVVGLQHRLISESEAPRSDQRNELGQPKNRFRRRLGVQKAGRGSPAIRGRLDAGIQESLK